VSVVSCCELWCGQSNAKLTIFNLDVTSGSLRTVRVTGSDNETTASADVVHLAASTSDSHPVVWAYVYPGTSRISVCVTSLIYQNFVAAVFFLFASTCDSFSVGFKST